MQDLFQKQPYGLIWTDDYKMFLLRKLMKKLELSDEILFTTFTYLNRTDFSNVKGTQTDSESLREKRINDYKQSLIDYLQGGSLVRNEAANIIKVLDNHCESKKTQHIIKTENHGDSSKYIAYLEKIQIVYQKELAQILLADKEQKTLKRRYKSPLDVNDNASSEGTPGRTGKKKELLAISRSGISKALPSIFKEEKKPTQDIVTPNDEQGTTQGVFLDEYKKQYPMYEVFENIHPPKRYHFAALTEERIKELFVNYAEYTNVFTTILHDINTRGTLNRIQTKKVKDFLQTLAEHQEILKQPYIQCKMYEQTHKHPILKNLTNVYEFLEWFFEPAQKASNSLTKRK